MKQAAFSTPLGTVLLKGHDGLVTSISIIDAADSISDKIPGELVEAVSQISEYFNGTRTDFTFKIAPAGTAFQQKVWEELRKIQFGQTVSYSALSHRLGDIKAIRAVASANGKNPLWIVIPCHRVIGADGSLTGYAGGLWRKQWLLEHESPARQQTLY